MAVYTIGDLHLSIGKDKPMDVFGGRWQNYTDKIREGFTNIVSENDITVLCGDLTWGMSLEDSLEDFRFINSLPGKKLIVKGNHDYWWTTVSKANKFFKENNINSIEIIHNNSYIYNNIALCGTRGWFFEEEKSKEHDKKILLRECQRLEQSLLSAGDNEKIVFLHYPPIYSSYSCPEILNILSKYDVKRCYYGHIHGKSCSAAFNGIINNIEFRLISADYINFMPIKVC